jgi:hypothetical protein
MAQAFDFTEFEQSVSKERLGAFARKCNPLSTLEVIAAYTYNLQLCDALYPWLHAIEIALRNSLYCALLKKTGDATWYDIPELLGPKQQEQLAAARANLGKDGKPDVPGRVVAELTFGFWVGLFGHIYEHRIWRNYNLANLVMPRAPKFYRNRNEGSQRLNPIRDLRNRVFHHEPIWHLVDLKARYSKLVAILGWINPSMKALVERLSDFEKLLNAGTSATRTAVFQGHFNFEAVCSYEPDYR